MEFDLESLPAERVHCSNLGSLSVFKPQAPPLPSAFLPY